MNERVVPKMTNFCVVKLSNSPAITQHREVLVPRRQDVVERRPGVTRLELDHFESQPDSPRIDQRFPRIILNGYQISSTSKTIVNQDKVTPPKTTDRSGQGNTQLKGPIHRFKPRVFSNYAFSARTPGPGLDTRVAAPDFQTRRDLV